MHTTQEPQSADRLRYPPPADYVETALEASCAALMALQLIRVVAPDEDTMEPGLTAAISSLRDAIADVRKLRPNGDHAPVHGFVTADRGVYLATLQAPPDQTDSLHGPKRLIPRPQRRNLASSSRNNRGAFARSTLAMPNAAGRLWERDGPAFGRTYSRQDALAGDLRADDDAPAEHRVGSRSKQRRQA